MLDINEIVGLANLPDSSSMLFVLDNNDNLLYSLNSQDASFADHLRDKQSGDSLMYDGKTYNILTETSTLGLKYYTAIPFTNYHKALTSTFVLICLYGAGTIIIGILLSFFLSNRQYKPIKRLTSDILGGSSHFQNKDNEYDMLSNAFSNLKKSNKVYSEYIENQNKSLAFGVIEKLMWNIPVNESEIELLQDIYHNIPSRYRMILLEIKPQEKQSNSEAIASDDEFISSIFLLIQDLLNMLWKQEIFIHPISKDNFTILIPIDSQSGNEREMINHNMQNIISSIHSHSKASLFLGVSAIYSDVRDLGSAYNEVKNLLYVQSAANQIIFIEDIFHSMKLVSLPLSASIAISDAITSGDKTSLRTLIYDCLRSYLTNKEDFIQIYYNIRAIIINAYTDQVEEENKSTLIPSFSESASLEIQIENIVTAAIQAADFFELKKNTNQNPVIVKMKRFINENYTDPELYGSYVANLYGISEKYLYTLFKKETGINFSEYIERMRLKEAIHLLSSSNLSISEISQKIGFNSQNTFYKAFKRVYNISPSTYRTQLQLP